MKASTGFEAQSEPSAGGTAAWRGWNDQKLRSLSLYSAAAKVKGSASSRVAATGLIGAELAHNCTRRRRCR